MKARKHRLLGGAMKLFLLMGQNLANLFQETQRYREIEFS